MPWLPSAVLSEAVLTFTILYVFGQSRLLHIVIYFSKIEADYFTSLGTKLFPANLNFGIVNFGSQEASCRLVSNKVAMKALGEKNKERK